MRFTFVSVGAGFPVSIGHTRSVFLKNSLFLLHLFCKTRSGGGVSRTFFVRCKHIVQKIRVYMLLYFG